MNDPWGQEERCHGNTFVKFIIVTKQNFDDAKISWYTVLSDMISQGLNYSVFITCKQFIIKYTHSIRFIGVSPF